MDNWSAFVHLSKRAGLGGEHLAVLQQWQKQGYEATVQSLVNPVASDTPASAAHTAATPAAPAAPAVTTAPSTFDLTADIAPPAQEHKGTLGPDFARLREAWITRMVQTRHPFLEKMTLFWHNHFATAESKVNSPWLMLQQNNTLRKNALGSFRQMLLDITADPAMLIWLDNARSTKKAPNENYGRELMELFTIGLTYTQEDVVAAARSLTGYQLNRQTGQVRFVAARHDDGVKTLLGRTGNFGPAEVIDILLASPHCAPFVTGKILQWFVHPNPPAAWIDKFARVWVQQDYHIGRLMQAIFLSDEFQSAQAVGSLVKSPVDFVIGLVRSTGVNLPARQLDSALTACGMQLFNPPNVAGWPGGQTWINSATLLARFNFAYQVARRLDTTAPAAAAAPASAADIASTGAHGGTGDPRMDPLLQEALILQPSAATLQALRTFAASASGHASLAQLRYLLWTAPEYHIC
ncbi:MAG: DUF1800 domain-containing protein [Alicyclobacillus sp.]|nr:DUF1800 domain-containing protein [Alicyclobacillus sp.]